MKLLRTLFGISAVLFFFLLGISIADKEYLSQSVVGICILADDQEMARQLREYIDQFCCTDAAELCREIENSGFPLELRREKMYVDGDRSETECFPDGVYDTIVIDCRGSNGTVYLKQIDPVSHRFFKTDIPVAASVQDHYIAFLSLLGKAEKITIDYLGCF